MAIGLTLSTGLMAFFNTIFGKEAFVTWGFRIPFLLSLVFVGTGLYIRLRIMESPQFTKVVKSNESSRAPLSQVLRRFPREIILAALLRMSEQMPFYVVTAFMLSYMTSGSHGHDYTYNFVLIGTLIAAGIEFVLVPLFGHLSDTIGRKKIYAWGAAALGVWGFIYFALLDRESLGWRSSPSAWVLLPKQYGPQTSIIAENFSANLRYTGAGLAISFRRSSPLAQPR